MFAEISHQKVFLGITFRVPHNQHVCASYHDERAEDVHDPAETYNQGCASRNHRAAQKQRAQNSIAQYPLLILILYGKYAEHHQEHEQVVDAKSFFDHVAGEKFQGRLPPVEMQQDQSERHGQANPGEAPQQSFAHQNFVSFTVKDAQVEGYGDNYKYVEGNPVKRCVHLSVCFPCPTPEWPPGTRFWARIKRFFALPFRATSSWKIDCRLRSGSSTQFELCGWFQF